MAHENMLITFA